MRTLIGEVETLEHILQLACRLLLNTQTSSGDHIALYISTKGTTMKYLLALSTLVTIFVTSAGRADDDLRRDAQTLFGRIEPAPTAMSAEAELGRALFWDTRASADGKTACASCHQARDWA